MCVYLISYFQDGNIMHMLIFLSTLFCFRIWIFQEKDFWGRAKEEFAGKNIC